MQAFPLVFALASLQWCAALTTRTPSTCSPTTVHITKILTTTTVRSPSTVFVTTTSRGSVQKTTIKVTTTIISKVSTHISTSCPRETRTSIRAVTFTESASTTTLPAQTIVRTSTSFVQGPTTTRVVTGTQTTLIEGPTSTLVVPPSTITKIIQAAASTTTLPAQTIVKTQTQSLTCVASTITKTASAITQTSTLAPSTVVLSTTRLITISASTLPAITLTTTAPAVTSTLQASTVERSVTIVTTRGCFNLTRPAITSYVTKTVQSASIESILETLTKQVTTTAPASILCNITQSAETRTISATFTTTLFASTQFVTYTIPGNNFTEPVRTSTLAASTDFLTVTELSRLPASTGIQNMTTTVISVLTPQPITYTAPGRNETCSQAAVTSTELSQLPASTVTQFVTISAETLTTTAISTSVSDQPLKMVTFTAPGRNGTLSVTETDISTLPERTTTKLLTVTESLISTVQNFNTSITVRTVTQPASTVTLPAVTCSVTSCGATPYITNGDFELGAIEPLDTSSTGCLMEDGVETIDVHGGNYAEGFQSSCASTVIFSSSVDLCPSQPYRLSAWIISIGQGVDEQVDGNCTLRFCADSFCGGAHPVESADYLERAFFFRANATQSTATVQLSVSCPAGDDEQAGVAFFQNYIDDFSIAPEPMCS